MNLYHAISIGQLMVCICLHLRNSRRNKSVCILPDFIVKKFPQYKNLVSQHVFDEVYLYPYEQFPVSYSMDVIRTLGDAIYQRIVPYSIHDFDEVYCAGTQFPFASWLVGKKRIFHYIEEGSGRWLEMEAFKKTQYELHPAMYELAEANGLYDATCPYIDRIYVDIPDDSILTDSRIIRCNISEELRHLSEDDRRCIRSVFGISDIMLSAIDEFTLFLTDHAANLHLLTWEEQIRRNTLTVDYFAGERQLVLKPHPDDLCHYCTIFPDARILPNIFPMELLAEFMDAENGHVLSFGSSCNSSMKARDKILLYGDYRYGGFMKIHRYYVIYALYNSIGEVLPCVFDVLEGDRLVFYGLGWKPELTLNSRQNEDIVRCFFCGSSKFIKEKIENVLQLPKSMVLFDEPYDIVLESAQKKGIAWFQKN